jgi:YHS domain-containing protein
MGTKLVSGLSLIGVAWLGSCGTLVDTYSLGPDPVCGVALEKRYVVEVRWYDGHAHSFCSEACAYRFTERPEEYCGEEDDVWSEDRWSRRGPRSD